MGEKECCKNENKSQEKKLVKATELPLHGNPYPPADSIDLDRPGFLELKVRAIRTSIQPFTAPICAAVDKTRDIVSIGIAHSQSSIQRISENQNVVVNSLVIAGSGIMGLGLARKRGFFKKLLYGSVLMGVATGVCYPQESKVTGLKAWYIAQNKLPELIKQKYETLSSNSGKDSSNKDTGAKSIE